MNKCGHCHSTARKVYCRKCNREMCEDCISADRLCGLCEDATIKPIKPRRRAMSGKELAATFPPIRHRSR